MTEHVKMEASGGVMIMTLPRPEKKNALTGAKYDAPLRIRHARALRDVLHPSHRAPRAQCYGPSN